MSQLGLGHHVAHDLLSSPFFSTTAANAGPRCRPSIINTHSYCCHTPLSRAELCGEGTRSRLIKVPAFCYCLAPEESVMKNRTTVKGGLERRRSSTAWVGVRNRRSKNGHPWTEQQKAVHSGCNPSSTSFV